MKNNIIKIFRIFQTNTIKKINIENIRFKKKIKLKIDALNLIIKACLCQKHEKK